MIGMFGVFIYGLCFTGEWIKEERAEQESRKCAQKHNNPIYYDKWGNIRYTQTGKKKTIEDHRNELHRQTKLIDEEYQEEKIKKIDRQNKEIELIKKEYEKYKEWYGNDFDLTFKEFFYMMHEVKILYKYELFEQFRNLSEQELKRVMIFKTKHRIIPRGYIV